MWGDEKGVDWEWEWEYTRWEWEWEFTRWVGDGGWEWSLPYLR